MTAAPSRRTRPPGAPPDGKVPHAHAPSALSTATHAPRTRFGSIRPMTVRRAPGTGALRVAPKVSRRRPGQRRVPAGSLAGLAAISAASMFLLVTFHVFAVQSAFQLDKLDAASSGRAARERAPAQPGREPLVGDGDRPGGHDARHGAGRRTSIPLNLAAYRHRRAPRPRRRPSRCPPYPYGDSATPCRRPVRAPRRRRASAPVPQDAHPGSPEAAPTRRGDSRCAACSS